MLGRDLLLHALQNQATPRAAWVPFVGVHGGRLVGVTAADYLRSADLLLRGLHLARERYRPDGLPVVFDLQLEAEVLGCELRWADETPPAVASHPLVNADLAALPRYDLGHGRFPVVFDALHRLRADFGGEVALYGLITGPFTLALHLLGNAIFLQMRRDPAGVQRLLDYCAGIATQTARGYLEHGADVVAVVDPMTSQISPKHFEEFVAPRVNAVFDAIRAGGAVSSLFVCGDARRNLEALCRTRCDNVSIDENVPLELCQELAAANGKSFGGNLKLTTVLLLGDAEDAKLEALRCLEIGGTNGFVLAPGCDLPYGTPPENLAAVAEMVHNAYQRHVAATTLRAKAAVDFSDIVLPDYAGEPAVVVDVVTLDSASCAPCQYMVSAAQEAAQQCPFPVAVHERKITTHAGLGYMQKLGVEAIPSICIDGRPVFASLIPDGQTLIEALRSADAAKGRG
ncbi:MAG: uroporphyrinogen decarboxylase [Phycisphaerales bacterium]|nr:uroporphyrinogen decarboxylase [Phycisphaerales bacterium]